MRSLYLIFAYSIMWVIADLIYDNPANILFSAPWFRELFIIGASIMIVNVYNTLDS